MFDRILITGGLGFIGSHLTRELLKDPKVKVTVVDDLSGTVLAPQQIVQAIRLNRPGALDVRTTTVQSFAATAKETFDVVFHLASIVGPAGVLRQSGNIARSIVDDAYCAVQMAKQSMSRLVNISTSEVYGGGVNGHCDEETPRVIRGHASARQEYAVAKLAAEVAIENLCRAQCLDAVTVRPFNVAGARQSGRGGFVLPRFVGQAILDEPLTVFGDGSQIRAFTDVRDIVSGMVLCATCGQSGMAYNVGNPSNRISIGELAERVLSVTGSAAGKIYLDPRTVYGSSYTEAADKFPDASRIMLLGWQPEYSLCETIADVYESMRNLPEDALRTLAGLAVEQESGKVPLNQT